MALMPNMMQTLSMDQNQINHMVALHEAGHAVASYLLGRPFDEIALHPQDGPGVWGSVSVTAGGDISPDDGDWSERDRLEKTIVILLAGPAAECRYTGASPWAAGGSDLEHVVGIACRRFSWGTEATLRQRVEHLWHRTKDLIYDEENWDCVQRVAEVLKAFKKIDWNLCGRLIQERQKLRRGKVTEVIKIMNNSDYQRIETELSLLLLWK